MGRGGSGAAVDWPATTRERRSLAGGGAGAPHGCVPMDSGGGATDLWAWPQCRVFEPIQIGQHNSNEFKFESNHSNFI
jgi:hypothetical protein